MVTRQQQQKREPLIQYEDFVPQSEWKDEPEANVLVIHLPGFAKEQIKITYVDSSRIVRVTGERPLEAVAMAMANTKRWSRFNKAFPVPQNCVVEKIHGSFKNNTLTITMPKITVDLSKEPENERLMKAQEHGKEISQKTQELEKEKPLKAQEIYSKTAVDDKRGRVAEPLASRTSKIPDKMQKPDDVEQQKHREEQKKALEDSYRKPISGNEKATENGLGKGLMEKIRGIELSEERKLMINVGAAAVVIFVLGAYVSYSLTALSSSSSGKSRE